jgi:hypothetical protein
MHQIANIFEKNSYFYLTLTFLMRAIYQMLD